MFFLVFILIPGAASGISVDAGENYTVEEGEEIVLDNVSSSGVDTWNWGIVDKSYTSDQVSDEARLEADFEKNPTFFAPAIVDDSTCQEHVWVRVLGTSENGPFEYDNARIDILNSLEARPGGPYRVMEGGSVVLDEDNSSGVGKEYNWGIVGPGNGMSLSDSVSSEPIFHAPGDIGGDLEVDIILEITSDAYFEKYYSSAHTTVKVWDTGLNADIRDNSVKEGSSLRLQEYSEGYIENYHWEILDDPTGSASLENGSSESAVFNAPPVARDDLEVVISLTVSNSRETDTDNAVISVEEVLPNKPEELLVEGEKAPQDLGTLSPSFSSIYSNDNPADDAENLEIALWRSGKDVLWRAVQEVDLGVGEKKNLDYKGRILAPSTSYHWKVRFRDKSGWGPWNENEFSTADLLSVSTSEAENFVSSGSVSSSRKAKAVEEALEKDIGSTVDLLEGISEMTLSDLLTEMSSSSNSPEHAAMILENLPENEAVEVVRAMMGFGKFQALDTIFSQENTLSTSKLSQIYESLLTKEKESLEEELSPSVIERLDLEGGDGGGIPLILKVALVLGILFVMIKVRSRITGLFGGGGGGGVGDKWKKLVNQFSESDRSRMMIKSNLPPEEIVESTNKAIKELGEEGEVKLGKEGDEIYLVRK